MKDFDTWLSHSTQQARAEIEGEPEDDVRFWAECRRCGRCELISRSEYLSGDKGWYIDDNDERDEYNVYPGLCGGGPGCTP